MPEVAESFPFWSLVLAVGATQGLLLSVALARASSRPWPAKAPALLVACVSLILAEEFLDVSGLQLRVPLSIGLTMHAEFLIGPLLYLYSRHLRGERSGAAHAFHLAPFALATLALIPFFAKAAPEKLALLAHPPPWLRLLFEAKAAHLTLYLACLVIVVGKPSSAGIGSGLEARATLTGYRRVLVALAGIGIASYALSWAARLGWEPLVDSDRFAGLMFTCGLYGLGFVSIRRAWRDKGEDPGAGIEEGRGKYRTSPLDQARKTELARNLLQYLTKNWKFTDPDLSIATVARDLGTPRHHLSQVTNEILGKGFCDLVNELRVQEVMKQLAAADERTILSLAFDAGFNSKATFHRAFRRFAGTTPSEFRRDARRRGVRCEDAAAS